MPRSNPLTSHENAGIAATRFVKVKAEIRSYSEAAAFLGEALERKVASNVMVVRKNKSTIAIRLYDTDIIRYYADGRFSADNGGFNTPTTSTRCNQFGPLCWFFYHYKKELEASPFAYVEGKPTGHKNRYFCKKEIRSQWG